MLAPPPSALGPGTWLYGGSRALMRRVLASNPRVNVFHRGFVACDGYAGGEAAIARCSARCCSCSVADDAMTPPKAAQSLQTQARACATVLVDGRAPDDDGGAGRGAVRAARRSWAIESAVRRGAAESNVCWGSLALTAGLRERSRAVGFALLTATLRDTAAPRSWGPSPRCGSRGGGIRARAGIRAGRGIRARRGIRAGRGMATRARGGARAVARARGRARLVHRHPTGQPVRAVGVRARVGSRPSDGSRLRRVVVSRRRTPPIGDSDPLVSWR